MSETPGVPPTVKCAECGESFPLNPDMIAAIESFPPDALDRVDFLCGVCETACLSAVCYEWLPDLAGGFDA